jgi:CspA family cold shock protein
MARLQGPVRWFSQEKGIGFVGRDQEEDVLLHVSAIREDDCNSLNEGEMLEYELVHGPFGPHAINVRRATSHLASAMVAKAG